MYRTVLLLTLVLVLSLPPVHIDAGGENPLPAREFNTFRFDFGPRRSPVMYGWTPVTESDRYTPERGYGILPCVNLFYATRG